MNFKDQIILEFPYLSGEQIENLYLLYEELKQYQHFLLTKNNPEREIKRLIFDSIICGSIFLNKISARTIVDVGSGVGFPGMIFAILSKSDFKFILIEPSLKRSEFLKHCVDFLSLREKVEIRSQQLGFLKEKTVVFKAFASLKKTLKLVKRYLPSDGVSYHFKSADYKKEWAQLRKKEQSLWILRQWAVYFFEKKQRYIIEIQRKCF